MSKVKVEVVQAFERFKIGDKPEMTEAKAAALEKTGLVKITGKAAAKPSA